MSQIRWIKWKCGHMLYQRLTAKFPIGATEVPENCPFCGKKGYRIREVEE